MLQSVCIGGSEKVQLGTICKVKNHWGGGEYHFRRFWFYVWTESKTESATLSAQRRKENRRYSFPMCCLLKRHNILCVSDWRDTLTASCSYGAPTYSGKVEGIWTRWILIIFKKPNQTYIRHNNGVGNSNYIPPSTLLSIFEGDFQIFFLKKHQYIIKYYR